MDLLDLAISLLTRWLMPHAPWIIRPQAHAFWLDGLRTGTVLGGAAAFVCLVLAKILLWFVRKRDRR